ncbi:MAG TPA: glycosyltransferase [Tepidisphaeraceae bacterium]|nr:glycosyltransferase [Tepidisphaeraceae bacterium]
MARGGELVTQTAAPTRSQPTHAEAQRAPTVTAIIIFLNGEKYLREAIESVLKQTFTDWELVLCDDGSTDGSTAIAKQYAARFPDRIRYIEHPNHENRGMSATRMHGVANSTGKYIAWLDADDAWLPNKLARQVEILDAHPEAAMCYGPVTYWYSWSGRASDRTRDFKQDLGVPTDRMQSSPDVFLKFINNLDFHPAGVMVRRDVLSAIGGYESEFRGDYEDVIAQTKTCLNYPVYAASESFYKYRQHEQSYSATGNREGRARARRLVYLRWLERYLNGKTVDPRVHEAVAQAMQPYQNKLKYCLSNARIRAMWTARTLARNVARCVLPKRLAYWIRAKRRGEKFAPPRGQVRFGDLRRTDPIDNQWGWLRGLPTDRYYIESFLDKHRADIRGRVLEIGDSRYSDQFSSTRIEQVDVLNYVAGDTTTIVGNLETGDNVPKNAFDCIILTQVLPFIFDVRRAIANCHAALKPGGVLLVTVSGISQVAIEDYGDFWRFTTTSLNRLLQESFGADGVKTQGFGNVLTATSFLYGIASNELKMEELDHRDEQYDVIIAARAVKSEVR